VYGIQVNIMDISTQLQSCLFLHTPVALTLHIESTDCMITVQKLTLVVD